MRQRWRLVVARDESARDLVQREVGDAWEVALRTSSLPLAVTEGATPRLRLAFGSPVPVGMLAEREPIDIGLTERRRIDEVRSAIVGSAPVGYRLVDLYDVWPGAPTLAASIVAGDYRATLVPGDRPLPGSTHGPIDPGAAVAALLAAPRIPRHREKAGGPVEVDIRPHILDLRAVAVSPEAGSLGPGAFDLWMRLRLGGDAGVGRPEEVIATLAERLGLALTIRRLCRECVVLSDGPA